MHDEISLEMAAEEKNQLQQHVLALKVNYEHGVVQLRSVIDLTLAIIEQLMPSIHHPGALESLRDHCLMEVSPHLDEYGRQAASYQLQGLEKITSVWLKEYAMGLRNTYSILVGSRGHEKI